MSDETPITDDDTDDSSILDDQEEEGTEETTGDDEPEGGDLVDDPSPEDFPIADGAPYDPSPENTTDEAQREGRIPVERTDEVEHPNLSDYGAINNNVVWTIVGVLLILALLIWIIPRLG